MVWMMKSSTPISRFGGNHEKHINLWFLCLTLILSGCSETATQVTGDVKLVVTQSFGQETMVEKDCTIQKDTTVYDVLESHVELNAKGMDL